MGKLTFITAPPFKRFLPIWLIMRERTLLQTFACSGSWIATPPFPAAVGNRQDSIAARMSSSSLEAGVSTRPTAFATLPARRYNPFPTLLIHPLFFFPPAVTSVSSSSSSSYAASPISAFPAPSAGFCFLSGGPPGPPLPSFRLADMSCDSKLLCLFSGFLLLVAPIIFVRSTGFSTLVSASCCAILKATCASCSAASLARCAAIRSRSFSARKSASSSSRPFGG
mmetsp:Transcript_14953/g.30086  ORF Transcript_14953/g.30086 Transcript_14953/m.30086 type:complete len:225 (-) Transcript_14953:434-1108(-)